MRVSSQHGRGTTFTVLLPITGEREERTEIREDTREIAAARKLRVLVIDDEDLVRESMGAMLEALGHEVVLCGDGRRAVEVAAEDDTLDLVLLDLVMPGLAGPEVFERLRESAPRLPVLVMSGHSVDGAAQGLLDLGAAGFIQKPCGLVVLRTAVTDVVQRVANHV